MIEIRSARLPQDAAAIAAIDTSFRTDAVLMPVVTERGVDLVSVARSLTKTFPLDDLDADDRPWAAAWVAVVDSTVIGFAAAGYEPWNRRLTLWHLYVDVAERGRGVARLLLDPVLGYARELGARHVWLETSNLNAPGVAAYKALGFHMTGFDLTLYDATPAEGQLALFFSRAIGPNF